MATSKTQLDSVTVDLVTPPTTTVETHAVLTFLDMHWLYFSPIQRLVFYQIPEISRSQFLETIIPNLKHSLSLTLERFPILAGNLIILPNSEPEICCREGDGVALISAECKIGDFNHFVKNDERDCADFNPLVPQLRPLSDISSREQGLSTPVLALQVTLFPDVGLCIGISNHHSVGDARSIFSFMQTWCFMSSKVDEYSQLPRPIFDKNLIRRLKDSRSIAEAILNEWRIIKSQESHDFVSSTHKVRKSFVITARDIEKLKNLVSEVRASSFTVTCSYVWTCLVKSRLALGDHDHDQEEGENFLFVADCRERSEPPIPANYFGNCLVTCFASVKSSDLCGEGGFKRAAEVIGRSIEDKFRQKDGVFEGVETHLKTAMKLLSGGKAVSVAGSTRYNYYSLDFGLGKPVKFEFVSIDESGAISLSGCKDGGGGVEVGLALTKPQMDAFTSVFMQGLNA